MPEPPDSGPLPAWPPGTAGILVVCGPRAIPISTGLRAGDRRLVFGLARRRETLARVRDEPQAAFAILARGMAFTAYGQLRVVREELEGAPNMAALELAVELLQDHLADGRTEMLEAARWRWREERSQEDDRRVMDALEGVARGTD